MKFLKQKNISKFGLTDQTLFTNQFGRQVTNATGGIMLPKGTTAQRPKVSGVKVPNGNSNGYLRYNTQTDTIEAYVAGVWQVVSAPAANAVQKQTLGPGDADTTIFGPLLSNPPQDDAILVIVGNVWQVSVTNFNVLYNYNGSGQAWIEFTSPPPIGADIVIYLGFSR